jgi:hypothetical protein
MGTVAAVLALVLTALITHPDPLVSNRTVGNLTMRTAPPSVKVGQVVGLTLTVTGPATYENCRPVDFWVDDEWGQRVWREVQFWACPAIRTQTLGPGQKSSFGIDVPTSGLVPGRYSVHGIFGFPATSAHENIPVVSFETRS